ncbi:putative ferric reductase transmembrane component 4 [Diaporthe ampelina]|uniref:Putative ferric reductase transmembrane component 4 n=1 Tax=Diaporthe ampelina TaxID=1214573 RepID=A0A0G2IGN2_9PEZI|nr:putative ferric reductase transmembrane component 4 [Diaporthe ampelina]
MMGLSSAILVVWHLFSLIHDAEAAKDGVVGFGISLYEDLCCQACHDSLSTLYLNCTTFMSADDMAGMDMGMDMGMDSDMPMGTTSDECYASNTPWLQTMAYCIQQNCEADGYPADKQATCFSNQAVAGASEPTFQDSLPATAPTVELEADAMWLNVTSLVNRDLYYSTHGTLGEFARSEYLHTRYSLIIYLVVIGICLVCGTFTQVTTLSPGLQKRLQNSGIVTKLRSAVFMPALFGSRRLEPLPGRAGYLPGRTLSIFIAIYVILNIVFSAVNFKSFQPNIYFFSAGFELCEYVGNRTGTLSFVNMSIAILFAGRNNPLIPFTGWSQSTFLTLHRWAARIATLQAIVHSIVYTMAYWQPGYEGASAYAAKAAEPFYYWGIIATIAMSLATGFAFLPLRIMLYETFLILHIILIVITLAGCWYHIIPHYGYDWGYQVWLYIAFAFWAAERVARVARIVYLNRLGDSKAVVEAIPNSNIIQVTVFPRVGWNFGPGQHCFLYFPGLEKLWENHPFSVAGWRRKGQTLPVASARRSTNESDAKETSDVTTVPHEPEVQDCVAVRFLVRVHSGATAELQRRLSSCSPGIMEMSVYTEGPYAGHKSTLQPLLATDTVLCLVGGIGITNALGFIQEYASANSSRGETPGGKSRGVLRHTKRFILAWSAREMALIEHVKRNFLDGAEGVEFSFWCTGDIPSGQKEDPAHDAKSLRTTADAPPTPGRMDIGNVIRSSVEAGHHTTVLVCGPGAMADEAAKEVVKCVKSGSHVDIVEEAYAW